MSALWAGMAKLETSMPTETIRMSRFNMSLCPFSKDDAAI
jgi:hypothetical protein